MPVDARISLKPNRAYPALPHVGGDVNSHTIVLKEVKEAVELHERRRGDPLDSFVRVRELIDVGLLSVLGDQVVNAEDTIFGGELETEFVQDTIGDMLVDSSEINFVYNDSTPSISAALIDGSIALARLSAGVQASLALADTAVQPARLLTAGAGLTGGGDLSADRTFTVGAGTGITVNADDVALSAATIASLALADTAVQPEDLADVATDGTFLSLTDTPSVYTAAGGYTVRVNAGATALEFVAGAALTRTNDTNVTLTLGGTPTTALLAAASLTLGWTGTLAVARGGTGAATLTGLLQGNGTSAVTAITNSSTVGQVLRVTGASTYAWGALDLADADAITGDLPDANLSANVPLLNATNIFTASNTFTSSETVFQSTSGHIFRMRDTDAVANMQRFRVRVLDGAFIISSENEARCGRHHRFDGVRG
jgi:hypothetical protein